MRKKCQCIDIFIENYYLCIDKYACMEVLQQKFYAKYALVQTQKVRSFVSKVDWSDCLVGIRGARGVGKTTMLLQYVRMNYPAGNRVLYASLDDLYFSTNSLYNLALIFSQRGGELLVLDEVHRYQNWAQELKNVYDDIPSLKLVYTGSSLLHMQKAKVDLSRRSVVYDMPGLSFREYIALRTGTSFPVFAFEDVCDHHIEAAMEIIREIKPLAYFQDYLQHGYYPFFLENLNTFPQKLSEAILTVLEIDIPQFAAVPPQNVVLLKRLLSIISNSVPFKPNMNSLSQRSGISINTMKSYLQYLTQSDLLNLAYREDKGINSLGKPGKIFAENPNLMFSLSANRPDTGNLRETFFYNQLSKIGSVFLDDVCDFRFMDCFFEIGGRSKGRKQIAQKQNAFIVKDDIEIGSDNEIPLWLFGFLY